ncbi:MAG: SGNH/GDSL hydrolase family protein [Lachnospiraceae bacterium]|nr:SGNH/GDSL hydrolase family protein [Lachnospiraceae bacterium]
MKSRNLYVRFGAVALMMALALAGCDGSGAKEPTETAVSTESSSEAGTQESQTEESGSGAATKESTVEPKETATPAPTPSAEEVYEDMVVRSLNYAGNNYRLKKVMEKMRAGEKVRIGILGGSVTEGAGAGSNDKGYAYQFVEEFGKTYGVNPDEQIIYVNAGLSGTPSVLGLMRYQQDILDPLGEAPDLLIIEFAVNDWQEATSGRAYESLVYEALKAKEDAAVICLCSVAKTAWNTQDVYLPIVKAYQIPLVSLKDAVFENNNKTRVSATTYFMDDYHPKLYGHKLMKDCLMNLFARADEEAADEPAEIPEAAVKGRDFIGMKQIDSSSKVKNLKTGNFGETDDKVVQEYFTKKASFPNNFHHPAESANQPFTLKLKCKKIIINYKTANDKNFGKADFYIDGKLVASADGFSSGGWNNCNVLMILDDAQAATHTLEVSMNDESKDKAFTILSISYVE